MARIGLLMLRSGKWGDKQIVDPNWVGFMTHLWTPANELFPQSFRWGNVSGTTRWGYGAMWWVWDAPRLPRFESSGDYYGAFSAQGWGGQYIAVLPARDLVVAHKVDLEPSPGKVIGPKQYVSNEEFQTILEMILASYCGDDCKTR
jgi:CubicO group peptidase (beta-lactamase class C family)